MRRDERRTRDGRETGKVEERRMADKEEYVMSPEELEKGAKPNGDLGSWLYVLLGIPCMILFFLVFFGVIGSCDGANVMVHG